MANAHKPEFIDKWSKELETLYTQIPDVLTSLAEDFQQLLGVEERKVVPATKPEQKD